MKPAPRIGFKRHLAVETIPGEGVFLVSPHGTTVISGSGVEIIAPLLDGTRSIGQVERAVAPTITSRQVENVVRRLAEAELISYRRGSPADEADAAAAAYWELAGLDPDQASKALARHRVQIVAYERIVSAVADACRTAGLAVADGGDDPAAFTLAFCDDYLEPDLADLNAQLLI